jgi:competence protein ComEC
VRAFQRLEAQLLGQRGHLFCWVPVCLGIGIGGYFALRFEPDVMMFLGLGCLLALGLILARIVRVAFAPLLVGLVLIGAGAGIAKYHAEGVSSPVLRFRY